MIFMIFRDEWTIGECPVHGKTWEEITVKSLYILNRITGILKKKCFLKERKVLRFWVNREIYRFHNDVFPEETFLGRIIRKKMEFSFIIDSLFFLIGTLIGNFSLLSRIFFSVRKKLYKKSVMW